MPDETPARPRADILNDTAALAARVGATALTLEVLATELLTPTLRRITLTAEGLAKLNPRFVPGHDFMLTIEGSDGAVTRRRYTIRRLDPQARTVDLDIVLHGDGPGARWAAAAKPGDRVEAIGPRGKVTAKADATWHLFVGDESFLPAAFAITEALPAGVAATVILEVDGPQDELPLTTPADFAGVQWIHRAGAGPDHGARLVAALSGFPIPSDHGFAYLGGEFHAVHAVRTALATKGLLESHLSAKPYWRDGSANANHGEPTHD